MSIKASEISDLIKARIDKFQSATEDRTVGTVVSVTDGIVRIHGLGDARYGEMLQFSGDLFRRRGSASQVALLLLCRLQLQHEEIIGIVDDRKISRR